MKIRFRRKKLPEWLVLFILAMPFAFFLLMELLHIPSLIKYTLDIAWLVLLFLMLANRTRLPNLQAKKLMGVAGAFFLVSLVGFLLNYQSPLYYLWGLRNNARFFVFFFACICYVDGRSVENYLKFFDVLFWINFPVTLYQFFVMEMAQDYLGGIFGTEKGCNGYMNVFLVIVVTKSILYFMSRKESAWKCLAKCAVALIVAVLSELKVFFLEFLVIAGMIMLMTKFTFRKFGIILLTVVGIVVSAQAVAVLFPDFAGWFSVEGILDISASEEGYTSHDDVNRLTAITYVLTRFLPSLADKLFGIGLGNGDYASFAFLTTPFYLTYGWTNYVWFSTSFLVLETGLIGLVIYIWFFVVMYFSAHKREKTGQGNLQYCQMAKIMTVISIIIVVSNVSMRTEAAYMMYFVLSLPFIRNEGSQRSRRSLSETPIPEEV